MSQQAAGTGCLVGADEPGGKHISKAGTRQHPHQQRVQSTAPKRKVQSRFGDSNLGQLTFQRVSEE